MEHAHPHALAAPRWRPLAGTLTVVVAYMLVEAVGGYLAGSLALWADAGHMLTDAAALGLALFAVWMSQRGPTARHTYGFYRAEILAALVNVAALFAISAFVIVEAFVRLGQPRPVDGALTLAVGAGGLLVNVLSLRFLVPHEEATLNERGARLHVWSDLLGSVQVVLAGAGIWAFGWRWLDPVASVVIGLLVVRSAWGLLRESTAVLLEGAPGDVDVDAVRRAMLSFAGVVGVHDLHVWTIASHFVALSAHVEVDREADRRGLLRSLRERLRTEFRLHHLTLELDEGPCEDAHVHL